MAASTDVFAGTTAALVPSGVNYLDAGVLRPAVAEHTTALLPVGARARSRRSGAGSPRPRTCQAPRSSPCSATRRGRRKFGAEPSVIGRTIRIDGVPVTIVGVGPAGHRAHDRPRHRHRLLAADRVASGAWARRRARWTRRPRRSGVLREGAPAGRRHRGAGAGRDADPGHAAGRRVPEGGSGPGHRGVRVERRAHPPADGRRCCAPSPPSCSSSWGSCWRSRAATWRRCCSCAATARAKEVSVRLALGATRGQLVRHLLTENLLLVGWRVHRRVPAGLVGDPLARRRRSADGRRPEPRLPRPGVRGRRSRSSPAWRSAWRRR